MCSLVTTVLNETRTTSWPGKTNLCHTQLTLVPQIVAFVVTACNDYGAKAGSSSHLGSDEQMMLEAVVLQQQSQLERFCLLYGG